MRREISYEAHSAGRSAALDVLFAWTQKPEEQRGSRFAMVKEAAAEAVEAAWPYFVRAVEGTASPLCDCPRNEEPPINPFTRQIMDHHCDCKAVTTAAALLGPGVSTRHGEQCFGSCAVPS